MAASPETTNHKNRLLGRLTSSYAYIEDFTNRYMPGVYAGFGLGFIPLTLEYFHEGKYANVAFGVLATAAFLGIAKLSGDITTRSFNEAYIRIHDQGYMDGHYQGFEEGSRSARERQNILLIRQ